jgi:hypothetical protein
MSPSEIGGTRMRVIVVCLLVLLSTAAVAEEGFRIQTFLHFDNGEFEFADLTLGRGKGSFHESNDRMPKIVFRLFDGEGAVLDEYDRWFPELKVWDGPPTDWDNTGWIEDHYREYVLVSVGFSYDLTVSHIDAYLVHDKVTLGEEMFLARVDVSGLLIEEYLLCNNDYQCNNDETAESYPDDCGPDAPKLIVEDLSPIDPNTYVIDEESSYEWIIVGLLIIVAVFLWRKKKNFVNKVYPLYSKDIYT